MTEQFVTEEFVDRNEGWVEISRLEALVRIETMLTRDLIAFEVDSSEDITPVGIVKSYTWLTLGEDGSQQPVLLALKDPINPDIMPRWFVAKSLIEENEQS